MRIPTLPIAVIVLISASFFAHETKAQGVSGYTAIDYYQDTNTVDAYSETDLDYDTASEYSAYVSLTVRNQYGSVMASDDALDGCGCYGYVAVELLFSGTPDATYIATGTHKAYANFYYIDYIDSPHLTYWYDYFNFGFFENAGISSPWYYYFSGPGPLETRLPRQITLGTVYDSDSVTTTKAKPDRLKVVQDSGQQPIASCPSIITRSIVYQVIGTTGNAINQTLKVKEALFNQTTNTCGNGQSSASACIPTTTAGQFLDTLSITCGGVSGAQNNPSCGFSQNQKIFTCGPTVAIELSSVTHSIKANEVLVNGTLQFIYGTVLSK